MNTVVTLKLSVPDLDLVRESLKERERLMRDAGQPTSGGTAVEKRAAREKALRLGSIIEQIES